MINKTRRKSIFLSLLIPLSVVIILESVLFYMISLYGGIENTLKQNAATVLTERLISTKNELQTHMTSRSFNLRPYITEFDSLYSQVSNHSNGGANSQVEYLGESADLIVKILRGTGANGIFLILNDQESQDSPTDLKKYGVCIRDMDQKNSYIDREDLLVYRAPSSIIDRINCSLDSSWEALYNFSSEEDGDYFFRPINVAWNNPKADSMDMGYLSKHKDSEQYFVYSVPLISEEGYPYGVLGVEFSEEFLSSLLLSYRIEGLDELCYVMVLKDEGSDLCNPGASTKLLYEEYFEEGQNISIAQSTPYGGFFVEAKNGKELFGQISEVEILSNNNPFGNKRLYLMAMLESKVLFSIVEEVRFRLAIISLICLIGGIIAVILVSRSFSSPITKLTRKVKTINPQNGFSLDRLGITEIDELIDSIEDLNKSTNRSIARTEFFSRMSHDMRTPLNAIISFSSPYLLEGISEAGKTEYFEKIHSSGNFLLGLINEVLDMTKIESKKVQFIYTNILESQVCASVIPMITQLSEKKGLNFSTRIRASENAFVSIDVQHLNQIVMNLLSNAIKFTPEGGSVTLEILFSPMPEDEKKKLCTISVSDSGIGMSDEFMDRLFTPFEQEHGGQEGSGLGLAITKALVEQMGGTIGCKSEKDRGSVFSVLIPFSIALAPMILEDQALQDMSSLKNRNILVCEDNNLNAQIICHLLEKLEIKSVVAADGLIGCSIFSNSKVNNFDAILMDIRMPNMDGLEATRRIRAMNRPDAQSVPIIAMTADAFEDDAISCREAGMNEHLSKPIQMDLFIGTLIKYLS